MAELKLEEYSNKGQALNTDLLAATSNISPSTDNNLNDSCGRNSDENSFIISACPQDVAKGGTSQSGCFVFTSF